MRGLRREAMLLLRAEPRRRDFPAHVQVGRLAGWPTTTDRQPVPRGCDEALRGDLVAALLLGAGAGGDGVPPLHCWVVRSGAPELDQDDLAWWRATRFAADSLGLETLPFVVVTRSGWSRPDTDEQQRWTRLRVVLPR